MYRFVPAEHRFITYPMPTRDAWMRDIAFTQDGLICGTSGPLPPINTEGGYPFGDLHRSRRRQPLTGPE